MKIATRTGILTTLVALGALVLSGCGGGTSTPSSPPSLTASATASPTSTPSEAEPLPQSAFPCGSPIPTAAAPTADQLATYREVITSANSQPMAAHACDTVTLIYSGTECCGPIDRDSAISQFGNKLYREGAVWTFDIDPALLAQWRSHFYAQYVPEGSLIAIDTVHQSMVSIIFDGNVITGLFTASLDEMMF